MQRAVGIILSAVGVVFLVAFWYGALSGKREPNFWEMMFPVVFILFSALFTIRAFRNSIRITEISIELRGLSGNRILPLDKVKGRRRYVDDSGDGPSVTHLVLEPNDDNFPKLDIEESYYAFDAYFDRWIQGLPDLDELDKTKCKTSNFGLV